MLKLENLKTGDKIYCIENYITSRTKPINNQELNKCTNPKERLKYISDTRKQIETYTAFIKDKTYTIATNIGKYTYINSEDKELILQDDIFINKHFISLNELRKQKLLKISQTR